MPEDYDAFPSTKFIHPLVIGLAVVLFFGYLTISVISWDGSLSTQLLQLAIFIVVNIYLVFMITKTIRQVKQSQGEEKLRQIGNLLRTAPFFVYLSIGISLYYFGKKILFTFELYEYRPIMMSATVLLLGLLIFNQLSFNPRKGKI